MLRFKLDGFHNRVAADWRGNSKSVATNAKRHAAEHGAAGWWRASDAFTLFYRDGDSIRQKTWRHAAPIR